MRPRVVVVAHRERMVAEGIAAALAGCPGIVPLAAVTAREAARHGERAEAVALDQSLTGAEEAAAALRNKGVRVVFVGEEGAGGEEDVARVSTQFPVSALAAALIPGYSKGHIRGASATRLLTPREKDVLSLVAQGFAGKQVARHLGISPKTVEQHKTRIFSKLGVPNQAAAVSVALGAGRSDLWTLARI
jgi:DNA-binding CsgD family transcriptional regulator